MSVSKVTNNPLTNVNRTESLRPGDRSRIGYPPSYQFQDKFNFAELPLRSSIPDSNEETINLSSMIISLMMNVLKDGCDIVPRGALSDKQLLIEASFQPPQGLKAKPIMHLPLKGTMETIHAINHLSPNSLNTTKNHVEEVVTTMANMSTNQELVKFIFLVSHEYGHYKSYCLGYHDATLRYGLSMMYSSPLTNYNLSYAVFSEEYVAWNFAKEELSRLKFAYTTEFEILKYSSLKAYFEKLNLAKADAGTYCKISMLGLDLSKLDLRKNAMAPSLAL